ncbi:hypothetical protein Goarm_003538, partial [Gossypium armourianum]|nr:hypothetical protein [Gossypium armourianum]
MGAFIYPCRHIAILTTAEAWACLHAITFGEELGFREICFEEDSLMLIRGIEISKVADQIRDLNCGRGRVFGRIAFIAIADITDAIAVIAGIAV